MKGVVSLGFSAPLVLCVFVVASCGSAPGSVSVPATASAEDAKENLANAPNPVAEPVGLSSLADSLRPLQDRFDELRGRPHFVALLSPT